MKQVFVNEMEMVNGQEVKTGAVNVYDLGDMYSVGWSDDVGTAEETRTILYEGASWQDALNVVKHGTVVKLGEGYRQKVDIVLNAQGSIQTGGNAYLMETCYADLHMNAEIYEVLRKWRIEQARRDGKPAYWVATNKALRMISAYVPHTMEELRQIRALGDRKRETYGPDMLTFMKQYAQPHAFPLDWVSGDLDPVMFENWKIKQTEVRLKAQIERSEERKMLLTGIAAGQSIDELVSDLQIPRFELMLRIEKLQDEGYDLDPFIERALAGLPAAEQGQIWDAMTRLGSDYLKPILTDVYGEQVLTAKNSDLLYSYLRLIRLRFVQAAKLQEAQ